MSRCPGASDLSPLAELSSLKELTLKVGKTDQPFAPLSGLLDHLEDLDVWDSEFADVGPAVYRKSSEGPLDALRAYYAKRRARS